MPKEVIVEFKSGDETGPDVECFDCGSKFATMVGPTDKVGDFITCRTCGGRGAYITKIHVEY